MISFEYPPRILGGAGTYAELLVKGLRSIGIEVWVIASGNQTVSGESIHRLYVPDTAYLRQFLFIRSAEKALSCLNSQFGFDLVHYNEPHMVRSLHKLPMVSTVHSSQLNEIRTMLKYPSLTLTTLKGLLDLGVRSPIGYVGDITAAHASDEIISPSSNLANLLSHDCFVSKEKIHFVPNAVDVQQLDRLPVDDAVLEDNSLVNGGYLLYIGRLSAVKGIHNLIEAFGRIGKKKELKLVIAGTGDYDHALRRQAQKFCNVVFTGFVGSQEIKKSLYRNCLALMLPSLYEAFPLVVLEAMTYGKPVVASCVGDIPSIVKNGVNGLLVKPNDIDGLVQAIARLYEDPDLRKNMGLRNRSVIMGNFTVEKMATRTFQVYSKLMEGD